MKYTKDNLKQYFYSTLYKGMNIRITFCAWTWKDVCSVLDISLYAAKQYVSAGDPRDEECIKNPLSRYVSTDAGEIDYAFPKLRNKIMKYADLIGSIDEYRKDYKTYEQTMKAYERGLLS